MAYKDLWEHVLCNKNGAKDFVEVCIVMQQKWCKRHGIVHC